jgi:hypothetical protein
MRIRIPPYNSWTRLKVFCFRLESQTHGIPSMNADSAITPCTRNSVACPRTLSPVLTQPMTQLPLGPVRVLQVHSPLLLGIISRRRPFLLQALPSICGPLVRTKRVDCFRLQVVFCSRLLSHPTRGHWINSAITPYCPSRTSVTCPRTLLSPVFTHQKTQLLIGPARILQVHLPLVLGRPLPFPAHEIIMSAGSILHGISPRTLDVLLNLSINEKEESCVALFPSVQPNASSFVVDAVVETAVANDTAPGPSANDSEIRGLDEENNTADIETTDPPTRSLPDNMPLVLAPSPTGSNIQATPSTTMSMSTGPQDDCSATLKAFHESRSEFGI